MAATLYTIGIMIAASFAGEQVDKGQIKKVLTLPPLWAIPIALVLRGVPLPETLLLAIRYLSAGTIPLAMMCMGLALSASSLRGYMVPVLIACALKLAALPFITYYAMGWGGVRETVIHQASVLEAGMPTAVMAGVVASRFGNSGKYVAAVIFISTLLSIVTIPALLLVIGVR